MAALAALIERTSRRGKFILLLNASRERGVDKIVRESQVMMAYNAKAKAVVASYAFATAISYDDALAGDEEIDVYANHYARPVFWRAAQRVVEAIGRLPGR